MGEDSEEQILGAPGGAEPSAAGGDRRQGDLAALDDMRSVMAVDADEVGACREAECPRPKGPHGFCRGHSCMDMVPESGDRCRLPKGHDGHWHDSGSVCWLVSGEFEGPDPGADSFIFLEVVELVLRTRWSSVSTVQRKLRLGFAKADRMVALMEEWGLVGPRLGSHARDILAPADMLPEVLAAIRAESSAASTKEETSG